MKKTVFGIVGLLAIASAADAHPHLTAAGPAPNSTVKDSPKAIRIQFSEGVEIAFTGVEITNETGAKQQIGNASLNPKDNKQLIVPLTGELAPGKYTVTWHAVGDDTHHVEGKYNFTIKP
jgi:methionine-rich copper-binding protein CopC